MPNEKIQFYSVDITIDEAGKPCLIEINGSNSGFDGFLIAYGDMSIQDSIAEAFRELIQARPVLVITRLVNLGKLPPGYLDKLVQDVLYFQSIENVHASLRKGIWGTTWARLRTDRPPSILGAGTSLDALAERYPHFKKVMLNVADPTYVIPAEYFEDQVEAGALSFKRQVTGVVHAIPLQDQDVVWLRCPTLAFAQPLTKGILVNPEFPYDAMADNKLFTYEALAPALANNMPLSIPVGDLISGSAAIGELLDRSPSDLFIRKPLLGSQARGIEILRRQDVEDYKARVAQLETKWAGYRAAELPLELQGIPQLLAAWAFSFDVSLLSELAASRPVYCERTGRYHYGCMRTLALVHQDERENVKVRFLGAYWRLAPVPVDGDGLLWERYVSSQSQGAFCERVSKEDFAIAEKFARDVLTAYCRALSGLPQNRTDYMKWEKAYWLARYRAQVPFLQDDRAWNTFLAEIEKAEDAVLQLKQEAEQAGFLYFPAACLTREQVLRARLPYLVREPHRIVMG